MPDETIEAYTNRLFDTDYDLEEELDKLIDELDRLSTREAILI
jgi:hypothetical protein